MNRDCKKKKKDLGLTLPSSEVQRWLFNRWSFRKLSLIWAKISRLLFWWKLGKSKRKASSYWLSKTVLSIAEEGLATAMLSYVVVAAAVVINHRLVITTLWSRHLYFISYKGIKWMFEELSNFSEVIQRVIIRVRIYTQANIPSRTHILSTNTCKWLVTSTRGLNPGDKVVNT